MSSIKNYELEVELGFGERAYIELEVDFNILTSKKITEILDDCSYSRELAAIYPTAKELAVIRWAAERITCQAIEEGGVDYLFYERGNPKYEYGLTLLNDDTFGGYNYCGIKALRVCVDFPEITAVAIKELAPPRDDRTIDMFEED